MKKLLAVLLVLAMVFSFAACGEQKESKQGGDDPKAEAVKVGLICIGDENDQGYTYNFMRGQKAAQEQLAKDGYNVEWIIKYNLVNGAPVADANRDLAEAGCSVIFNNSYDHSFVIGDVAADYPEIQFVGCTGDCLWNDDYENTSNAFAEIYKGRYLAGVVAGLKLQEMIDKGEIKADEAVIGYVAAYYYAEVVSGYTAYYLGARSVCPSVKMITQAVSSWSDATAEGNAAKALLAQGAKLISQHSDNTTPATEAEKVGAYHTGYNNDMSGVAPKASLISTRIDWTKYFTDTVEAVIDGKKIEQDYCGTYANGEVVMTDLNTAIAAQGTAEKLAEIEKKVASGEIKIFDTSKFTVGGETLTQAFALDTDGDWTPDSCEAVQNGEYIESVYMSAPYFNIAIDGITRIDE